MELAKLRRGSQRHCWVLMLCAALVLAKLVDAVETSEDVEVSESGQLGDDASVEARCAKTKGSWCSDFLKQAPVPWRPAPRGDKACPGGCNNVGRCNYDTGYCDCPAGWTGPGCRTRQKRPCTNHFRTPEDPNPEPHSHIGPDKRDLNWTEPGITASRCYGICDDDLGMCYCDGPLGRIPAPDDAPAGTPPRQRGRPLMNLFEQPSTTYDGKPTWGGDTPYEKVYGPEGYCNVTKSPWKPTCGGPEDLGGEYCDQPNEAFCPGACSGHGHCNLGFCICDEGYYGHDCARRKAGMPLLPSTISARPWVSREVHEPPAALEPPPSATRRRPLIYVYDLEPMYNAKMLQYRHASAWCTHRYYTSGNVTSFSPWCYGVESGLHEYLLISEHRTFDPEEADFFYVPVYISCLIWPVLNYADFPVFYSNGGTRVMHAVNMLHETREWIDQNYPFWKRRSGRDHIWTFPHDEGACWAPNSIAKSIWLTHWGRTDVQHTSKSSFEADNYTRDFASPRQPKGYTYLIEGHACYDPKKDLVIPIWRTPLHYARSPLQGAPAKPRDIFLFFRGDVGKKRSMLYSRGVRQKIYNMSITHNWKEKYNVLVGDGEDVQGDYSDLLSRSLFCLVATGDGWSARTEDAVLHGCIPVMVIDGVHMKFETLFDVDTFSVRIPEADVANILTILKALSPARVRAMQASLGQVWHRYRYAALPGVANATRAIMASNEADPLSREAEALSRSRSKRYPRPFKGDPTVDDAFSTIIQWLHSRIPDTR